MATYTRKQGTTRPSPPPSAHEVASASELAPLIEHAKSLDEFAQRLKKHLPEALANQIRLANCTGEKLVILVSTPAWKNRLRLEEPAILAASHAAGFSAKLLSIKISPEPPVTREAASGKPLSNAVRESLRATAASVNDPELRAQLLKLASLPET